VLHECPDVEVIVEDETMIHPGTVLVHDSGENGAARIGVIIPAYNEERFIGSVVLQAHQYGTVVIVVDDGSTDATAEIARAAGAVVIGHERNQGKGAALKTGFRKAGELDLDVVVVLDGDGQHRPEEIGRVTGPVLEGKADIVVGSRYLEKQRAMPRHRALGHGVFTWFTNLVSGVSVTDSQSGFRAFSPRAVEEMVFSSHGFSVESEMQVLAGAHHLRVAEVPITALYRDKPKRPVVAHGMRVLNGLLRLVGQYRPLLFFGLPGLLALLASLALGGYVVVIYQGTKTLAVGYAMITVLLAIIGILSFFTGIILHSVRGLLLEQRHQKEDQPGART
jgi:glycosyltransferase involved in cell wall biosynthesis